MASIYAPPACPVHLLLVSSPSDSFRAAFHIQLLESPMALDTDTVRRIARLARIHIPEADLETLAGELSDIIGWVEQLAEVDTAGVEPMASVVETTLKQRDDVVADGGYPDKVLANAPDAANGFFTVPKVVE